MPNAVRLKEGYGGPGGSWLSHAKKTRRVLPEVFICADKPVSFHYAKAIANSRVGNKPAVLQWVIETHPTDLELRDRIRVEVDGIRPIIKPSDQWTQSGSGRIGSGCGDDE